MKPGVRVLKPEISNIFAQIKNILLMLFTGRENSEKIKYQTKQKRIPFQFQLIRYFSILLKSFPSDPNYFFYYFFVIFLSSSCRSVIMFLFKVRKRQNSGSKVKSRVSKKWGTEKKNIFDASFTVMVKKFL